MARSIRNANELAAYLADFGARNFKSMVVIAQPFGRVFEIWNDDMGLGLADARFMAVNEEDVGPAVVNEAEVIEQEAMADEEAQEQVQGGVAQVNVDGEPVEVVEIAE
ncbi:hypothetical protein ACET3Z_004736 [Daucus carota]